MNPIGTDSWPRVRTVLGHDWLTGMRGGERVLEILCDAFPDAPVLTLIHNRTAISDTINSHPVRTSWLQRLPGIERYYRCCLPLFPSAVNSIRVPPADLLVTTSHCVAKSLKPPPGMRHICYCFTPMRYAWLFYEAYFGPSRAKGLLTKPMLAALRRWDRRTASRVDRFIAISEHVRERIRAFYGREADVVYPPVDTDRCRPSGEPPESFDLIVSALVPYKRIDLAVQAYNRTGDRLKIVGTGGEYENLRKRAAPNIELLGWLPDESVLKLYQRCRMLIFPGEEDFGIVPVEAQACGRPVVAFARGGALETVVAGQTGVFFEQQSVPALVEAVGRCAAARWDPLAIRAHAEQFSVPAFARNLGDALTRNLGDYKN